MMIHWFDLKQYVKCVRAGLSKLRPTVQHRSASTTTHKITITLSLNKKYNVVIKFPMYVSESYKIIIK